MPLSIKNGPVRFAFLNPINAWLWLASLTGMVACVPEIEVTMRLPDEGEPLAGEHLPFAIIDAQHQTFTDGLLLGQIEVGQAGVYHPSDYRTLEDMARQKALSMGGNGLVITTLRTSSMWSNLPQLKADVYLIENAQMYEREVRWHEDRKLTVADFKGPVRSLRTPAATYASFRYFLRSMAPLSNRHALEVTTFFDCQKSHFAEGPRDSLILAHEQLHFDIAELFARKFVQRIATANACGEDVFSDHERLASEVGRELQARQDAYDKDVYARPSRQQYWERQIARELAALRPYRHKRIFLKKR